MKTLVVVQARMGSSRLPGKVLLPLAGRPMLQRMLERVLAARTRFDLIVATTTDPADDAIRSLCRTVDVDCVSGHPTDLLDRHYRAAVHYAADVVVKIPSDCPMIDPGVIDRVLSWSAGNSGRYDYVSNLHPATYPDGNDVEVIPFPALETAWQRATRPLEREHTTPFIWGRPEAFRLGNVSWETGLDYSRTHRWTVDYAEDYLFARAVFDSLWSPHGNVFSLWEILRLIENRPELRHLNARYAGTSWQSQYKADVSGGVNTTNSPVERGATGAAA